MARSGAVSLAGPAALMPLMQSLAARYELLYPGVTVDTSAPPLAPALARLRARSLDFALLPRRLADHERDLLAFPVARDGLGVLVRRAHPLQTLSVAGLAARLSQGRAGGLAVHDPQGRVDAMLGALFRIDGRSLPRVADAASWVRDEGSGEGAQVEVLLLTLDAALGFASRADVRLVAIDGRHANPRNLRKGDYPLLEPVNLVSRDQPAGEGRHFVDFCLSAQIFDLVRQHGLIPYAD